MGPTLAKLLTELRNAAEADRQGLLTDEEYAFAVLTAIVKYETT